MAGFPKKSGAKKVTKFCQGKNPPEDKEAIGSISLTDNLSASHPGSHWIVDSKTPNKTKDTNNPNEINICLRFLFFFQKPNNLKRA